MTTTVDTRTLVAESLRLRPIIGVVRTSTAAEAARQARTLLEAGIELVEITFSVPGATTLVRQLLGQRSSYGPPWIGMGTVTSQERARQALEAGAEFLVSPNVQAAVAEAARRADRFLVMGALTPTEIVAAHALGADLVKVYPLPPVGGAAYLATVRQPLGDIPMLAAGGFGIDDIPAYLQAGAVAFGIGFPLLAGAEVEPAAVRQRIARALRLAAPMIADVADAAHAAGATHGAHAADAHAADAHAAGAAHATAAVDVRGVAGAGGSTDRREERA